MRGTLEQETYTEYRIGDRFVGQEALMGKIRELAGTGQPFVRVSLNLSEEGRKIYLAQDSGELVVDLGERGAIYLTLENLLIGLVAARPGVPLSNPDVLGEDKSGVFNTLRKKIGEFLAEDQSNQGYGVDEKHKINFEKLPSEIRERIFSFLKSELVREVRENGGEMEIGWFQHRRWTEKGRNLRPIRVSISLESLEEGRLAVKLPKSEPRVIRISSLIDCKAEGGAVEGIDPKRIETGVKRVIAVELYKVADASLEKGRINRRLGQRVEGMLQRFPRLFDDETETMLCWDKIVSLHKEAIISGIWILHNFRSLFPRLDFDSFGETISKLSPETARKILGNIAGAIDFYSGVRLGTGEARDAEILREEVAVPESEEEPPPLIGKLEETENTEAASLRGVFGIPSWIGLPSMMGVAWVLGIYGKKVFPRSEEERLPSGWRLIYETADYANPAELLMLARLNSGREKPPIYITAVSRPLGKYLKRVVVPTLAGVYGWSKEQQELALNAASRFDSVFDARLEEVGENLGSEEARRYFSWIGELTGADTFADAYRRLNESLCAKFGLVHLTAEEFLRELTVGEVRDYIGEISPLISEALRGIEARLREEGFSEERIRRALISLFGEIPEWGISSRLFLKRSLTGEEVPLENVNSERSLTELMKEGIVLGGNGWVVVTHLLAKKTGQSFLFAHKNTSQGGNYCLPLTPSSVEYMRALVSPLVRVVPQGGSSAGGDGLDIGVYFLYPQLTDIVLDQFSVSEGGYNQRRVVVAKGKEFWHGGRRKRGLIVEVGTQSLREGVFRREMRRGITR